MNADGQFLAECEREPLHLSGAIQPHGTVLIANSAGIVTHAAANAEGLLGLPAERWLGRSLPSLLASIAETLSVKPGTRLRGVLMPPHVPQALEGSLIRSINNNITVELVPLGSGIEECTLKRHQLPKPVPMNAEEMARAETTITELVASLTGFSRIMYYRFRDDGDGEVIAEVRRDDIYGSYLGLRYPASDIPQIARQLYLENPWRLIPNAEAPAVPLLSQTDVVPDLTFSDLRSVSPVHQTYLANMGVAASLSFPLVERNELVGLLVAHHSRPKTLPYAVLQYSAAQVTKHAELSASYQLQQSVRRQDRIARKIDQFRLLMRTLDDIANQWDSLGPLLLAAFQADGVHLHNHRLHFQSGACGGPATCGPLEEWFLGCEQQGMQYCENLHKATSRRFDTEIAGALAFRVCKPPQINLYIYLTRREHIHEVAWGGQPDKPIERCNGELTIAPRRSFEKWVEKRLHYCRPWDIEERMLALALRVLLTQELHS